MTRRFARAFPGFGVKLIGHMKKRAFVLFSVFLLAIYGPAGAQLQPLRVSDNKRFLVTGDGQPFFWLGDTGWELFHRLNKTDAEAYFKKFIMPGCRSGRTIGVGPNHRSRAAGLSREAFHAREIPALIPLNLRRLAGTCEEIAAQIEALPSHLRRLVAESIALSFFDLESPIESQFLSHGAASELLDNRVMLHKCVRLIEDAVQIKRRLRVFEVARNYPVLMQSDIASHHFSVTGPARLEENVSMAETNSRMQRSRAVVSVVHTNDEVHDRTLNGINAGSVNIIEDNRINRQLFRHGENALFFRYDDDSLQEALDLVCFDPSSAFDIAEAGFALRDDPYFRFGGFDHLVTL